MRLFRALLLGPLLLAAAAAAPSRSEPLLFFGEDWDLEDGDFPSAQAAHDAFVSYLGRIAREDFEGQRGAVLELPLGGYGAHLEGRANDSVSTAVARTPGRRATSRERFFEHGSETLVIELDRPAEAVGFYGIDVGDAGGALIMTVAAADGSWERSYPVPHRIVPRGDGRGDAAVLFFGVVAPGIAITRIELRNAGDAGDGFGYDDLIVGQVRRLVS
jgi:hypothetical protein